MKKNLMMLLSLLWAVLLIAGCNVSNLETEMVTESLSREEVVDVAAEVNYVLDIQSTEQLSEGTKGSSTIRGVISGVGIIAGSSSSIQPPYGWFKINVDLNRNTSRHNEYVYLCYTYNDLCLYDLSVKNKKTKFFAQIPPIGTGWSRASNLTGSNGDLNQGAGGNYIYLYQNRDLPQNRWEQPITGIGVAYSSYAGGGVPSGWTRIAEDLNDNAGGDYVYIIYKRY